ncbi:MAG TPA: hypothetical protein DCP31_31700 [Cyanobacteria bacterium UBA8543]|nr:hypothetical protein [Cyanobacteria bacterium UBA8543]
MILKYLLSELKQTLQEIEKKRETGKNPQVEWDRYEESMTRIDQIVTKNKKTTFKEMKGEIEEFWVERERLVKYIKSGTKNAANEDKKHFALLSESVEKLETTLAKEDG